MFLAKGLGVHTITSAGNVETAAGARYALPIQRWTLGANITGNINFPNQNNHKNIQLDMGSNFIESNNASSAITYSDTDSTVLKIVGSGNISAGALNGSGVAESLSVSRSYAYDVFGSAYNSTDTGKLPNVTNATRATNGVFTFASDVTAGSGTNGTLSTSPPNNVFRMGFQGPENEFGDWNTTLFTVTSISANGLTVTTSNNTTGSGFYTWGAYSGTPSSYVEEGTGTTIYFTDYDDHPNTTYGVNEMDWDGVNIRVGTVSLDPQNDRIKRGTYHSYQSTNSSNSRSIYGGSETTFNDQTLAGGPNGGSTATESVLGTGYHILTLRPGRWYSFKVYQSAREHSRGYGGGRPSPRWQISGIPSTMTKSWGSATNSPMNTQRLYQPHDGDSLWFYGYVTESTLIAINGESENNVRAGMPNGGGPKTPFMGGSNPGNTSGTTYYPALVNSQPYSPDYKAFDGAGVTTGTDGTVSAGLDLSGWSGSYSRTGFL